MSVADMVANLGEKTEWKVLQAAEDLGAMVSIKDVGPEQAGASETPRYFPSMLPLSCQVRFTSTHAPIR